MDEETDMIANMYLWKIVEETDEEHLRPYRIGEKELTTVNATYQIRRATMLWGPYGSTWGIKDDKWEVISMGGGIPQMLALKAKFFYPHEGDWPFFPVAVDVPLILGQDSHKKALTGAIKKGLAYLGFSADVHLGEYDEDITLNQIAEEGSDASTLRSALLAVNEAKEVPALASILEHANQCLEGRVISKGSHTHIVNAIQDRQEILEKGGVK